MEANFPLLDYNSIDKRNLVFPRPTGFLKDCVLHEKSWNNNGRTWWTVGKTCDYVDWGQNERVGTSKGLTRKAVLSLSVC